MASVRRTTTLLCFLGYLCLAAGGFEMLKLKKLAKWAIIGRAMQPNVIPIPIPMAGGGFPHPGAHIPPHLPPPMLPPPMPVPPPPPMAYPVPVPVHHHHHHVVSMGGHPGEHHHMHAASKAKK